MRGKKQKAVLVSRKALKNELKNKILVYKAIIKPTWTYGMQLWGTACEGNRRIIQRFQNKALRIISDAHIYHSNVEIHEHLKVPWVRNEITKASKRYTFRLHSHPNTLALSLLHNSLTIRRLKRVQVPFPFPSPSQHFPSRLIHKLKSNIYRQDL